MTPPTDARAHATEACLTALSNLLNAAHFHGARATNDAMDAAESALATYTQIQQAELQLQTARVRTPQEIEYRLAQVLADQRLSYPSADIAVNAPLALIQLVLETQRDLLRWILTP